MSGTAYTPATGVAATPNVSFTYDTPYNRVLTMLDGTGTTTYGYNQVTGSVTTGAGRLHTVSTPIAGATALVAYNYDELGRVTNRTVDGANPVGTTFDTFGRVTNVTNPLGAFIYAYVDTTSRLNTITYPTGTGLTTKYSYFNNAGDQRLQTIQNLKGTTNMSKFDYTYNPVGTIKTWTAQADAGTAVLNTLAYDGADQLTKDDITGGSTAHNYYNYDPAGNRLLETTAVATNAGRFNKLNQLTGYSSSTTATTVSGHASTPLAGATVNAVPATITSGTNFSASVPLPQGTNVVSVVENVSSGASETQRYQVVTAGTAAKALTYDINGNVLTDENSNAYTWDALNRLTRITYPSTAYTTFTYDGLSRRTQITEYNSSHALTSTKNYLWIGQEIAEERTATNVVTKRFFPQGEQQSGTNYYYSRDHLGSVREMLDSSGTLVSRMAYDPYGRITVVSGTTLPTKQYAGYYQHETSGLSLTKYRAYAPNTGRWLSRDPLGEKGGLNLYDNVLDDPINSIDPLGLTFFTEAQFLFDFLTGSGMSDRDYGRDSTEAQEMRFSPGVEKLRQYFYDHGCNSEGVTKYGYGTLHAIEGTVLNPNTADWSSTAFQVGAFDRSSITNNGDGTITFEINNDANLNSLLGHLNDIIPDLLPNPDIGPGREIHQTFHWTEPINKARCKCLRK